MISREGQYTDATRAGLSRLESPDAIKSLNSLRDVFKTLLPFFSLVESGRGHVSHSSPDPFPLLGPPALACHWNHVEERPFPSAQGPTTWPQQAFKVRDKAKFCVRLPRVVTSQHPQEVG